MIFFKTRVCNDDNLNQLYYNGITCVCLCFCCPVKDLIITFYVLNSIFSYTQVVFFSLGRFISISDLFLLFIFFFFRKIFCVLFFSEFFFVFLIIFIYHFLCMKKKIQFSSLEFSSSEFFHQSILSMSISPEWPHQNFLHDQNFFPSEF